MTPWVKAVVLYDAWVLRKYGEAPARIPEDYIPPPALRRPRPRPVIDPRPGWEQSEATETARKAKGCAYTTEGGARCGNPNASPKANYCLVHQRIMDRRRDQRRREGVVRAGIARRAEKRARLDFAAQQPLPSDAHHTPQRRV